jgi:hypothetical protein
MTEYQPNSHRSRESQTTDAPAERRVEKVVKGKVQTRENKGRKLTDIFISEDVSNVKSYIFMDVLVPAIKKAISDIVTDGIDMVLYGGTGRSKKSSSGSKVSYRSYYDDRPDRRESSSYSNRTRFDYDDILFDSRVEAEKVYREMQEVIERYGYCSVADMYDMAGLTPPFTANKFGWTSVRNAEIVRVRGGDYVIKLPKITPFD